MKTISNPILFVALAIALAIPLVPHTVFAETVRKPVWAGLFYEADPSELEQNIDQLTRKARETRIQIPKNKRLRAIILPHAGYIYSGWTAAHAARVLSADQFSKILLLGPDHRIGLKSAAICDVTAYETPPGENQSSQRQRQTTSANRLVSIVANVPGQRTFPGSDPAFLTALPA
jgi:AmmeMemoRadiSam system protein B